MPRTVALLLLPQQFLPAFLENRLPFTFALPHYPSCNVLLTVPRLQPWVFRSSSLSLLKLCFYTCSSVSIFCLFLAELLSTVFLCHTHGHMYHHLPHLPLTVMHQLPLHAAALFHQLPLRAAALLGALTKPKTQSRGSKQQPYMQEAEGMFVGYCRGRVS